LLGKDSPYRKLADRKGDIEIAAFDRAGGRVNLERSGEIASSVSDIERCARTKDSRGYEMFMARPDTSNVVIVSARTKAGDKRMSVRNEYK